MRTTAKPRAASYVVEASTDVLTRDAEHSAERWMFSTDSGLQKQAAAGHPHADSPALCCEHGMRRRTRDLIFNNLPLATPVQRVRMFKPQSDRSGHVINPERRGWLRVSMRYQFGGCCGTPQEQLRVHSRNDLKSELGRMFPEPQFRPL